MVESNRHFQTICRDLLVIRISVCRVKKDVVMIVCQPYFQSFPALMRLWARFRETVMTSSGKRDSKYITQVFWKGGCINYNLLSAGNMFSSSSVYMMATRRGIKWWTWRTKAANPAETQTLNCIDVSYIDQEIHPFYSSECLQYRRIWNSSQSRNRYVRSVTRH